MPSSDNPLIGFRPSPRLMAAVEDYQFAKHLRHRSAAIERLIAIGLQAEGFPAEADPAENAGPPPDAAR